MEEWLFGLPDFWKYFIIAILGGIFFPHIWELIKIIAGNFVNLIRNVIWYEIKKFSVASYKHPHESAYVKYEYRPLRDAMEFHCDSFLKLEQKLENLREEIEAQRETLTTKEKTT